MNPSMLFHLLFLVVCLSGGNSLEGFHRCGDPSCSSVVARGRTVNKYMSGEQGLLSFKLGEDVLIYSKGASENDEYWSVQIKGKRGFAPKRFLSVTEEINRDLKYEFPLTPGKYVDGQQQPTVDSADVVAAKDTPQQQPPTTTKRTTTTAQQPPADPVIDVKPPSAAPQLPMEPSVPLNNGEVKANHVPSVQPSAETPLEPPANLPIVNAPSKTSGEQSLDPSSMNLPPPSQEESPPMMTPPPPSREESPPMTNPSPPSGNLPSADSTTSQEPQKGEPSSMNPPPSQEPPQMTNPPPPSGNAPSTNTNQEQQSGHSGDPLPTQEAPSMMNPPPPSQGTPSNNPPPPSQGTPSMNPPPSSQGTPSMNPPPPSQGTPSMNPPPPSQGTPSMNPPPSSQGTPSMNPPPSSQGTPSMNPPPPSQGTPSMNPSHVVESPPSNNPPPPSHVVESPPSNNPPSHVEYPSNNPPSEPAVDPSSSQNNEPKADLLPESDSQQSESMGDSETPLKDDEDITNNATRSNNEQVLREFEEDEFYKASEEDYDDVEDDNSSQTLLKEDEDNKNIVKQVIEEFNGEETDDTAQTPSSSFGFHYTNQIKNEEESTLNDNNEDNHVQPPLDYETQSEQHIDYGAGSSNSVHLPQSGSEEVNESGSPEMNGQKPMFNESPSESSSSVSEDDETINFFDRIITDIYPSWVHEIIHVNGFEGFEEVSSEYYLCMVLSATSICVIYFIRFLMEKTSRESPLKARVALLDKQLFQSKNDNLIIKKQLESSPTSTAAAACLPVKTVVKQETPSHVLAELEQLKEEREKLLNDSYNYQLIVQEKSALEEEKDKFMSLYEQSQQELLEAENIVQECLEEKKQAKVSSSNNEDMLKALTSLEDQLNSQKQAVLKYESKVKKRDCELKEKIHELRKLRADTANAKLETDRVGAEKEGLLKRVQALEGIDKERESQLESLINTQKELKALKTKLGELKEDFECKESELEAKNTEIQVLSNTIGTLKIIAAASEGDSEEGWDFQETPSMDVVEELSRCKVDLKKASEACKDLSEQLTGIESERDELKGTLSREMADWEVARKVKDQVLREKAELEHKHSVLAGYFNQREAELQKQLGLQGARLNEAEAGSESSSKKMVSLCEELECTKSQFKTLKLEMEEMERSWKSQNASLEKKQHESWVTVRQEARRNAEAQNEMQTLRSKLTVTEAKILEKETEIKRVSEENAALRETIQNISMQPLNTIIKPEPIYPNGHSLSVLPVNGKSSGTPSLSSIEPPPPELPPLPFLPPMMPMMPMLPHNQSSMMDRPAPVGRRSPSRTGGGGGRYSRSPSPPAYYNNSRGGNNMFRDSSPGSRSDRSRFDYSPSPPAAAYRRHSSRERSPDRFSTRSDRSDLSHTHHHHTSSRHHHRDTSYRDTPPRESNNRHHYHRRSSNEFPGSGLDDEEEYTSRSKRTGNRNRNNNNSKNSRNKSGPKTSSPMVDGRDLNI